MEPKERIGRALAQWMALLILILFPGCLKLVGTVTGWW
jgi:hypothetical protein